MPCGKVLASRGIGRPGFSDLCRRIRFAVMASGTRGEHMSRYREGKQKRDGGRYLAVPVSVLNSRSYARLSPYAVRLLFDLGAQYKGDNNGDLTAAWKLMQPRGWKSEATLNKAKQELLQARFIIEMRKGARPNKCSLYALTWFRLDTSPKHDARPSAFVFGAWKAQEPVPPALVKAAKNAVLTTSAVVARAA